MTGRLRHGPSLTENSACSLCISFGIRCFAVVVFVGGLFVCLFVCLFVFIVVLCCCFFFLVGWLVGWLVGFFFSQTPIL